MIIKSSNQNSIVYLALLPIMSRLSNLQPSNPSTEIDPEKKARLAEEEAERERVERVLAEEEAEREREWDRQERERLADEEAEYEREREWVDSLRQQLGAKTVTDEKEAEKLENWFKQAFLRGLPPDVADNTKKNINDFINNANIKNRILGGMTIYQPKGSKGALMGYFSDNGVFIVTNFAPDPNNRMDAVSICRQAYKSNFPILFAVTGSLSALLKKIGFKNLASFQQKFQGLTQMKDVMVNNSIYNNKDLLLNVSDYLQGRYGVKMDGIKECMVCGKRNIFDPQVAEPVCDRCKKEYNNPTLQTPFEYLDKKIRASSGVVIKISKQCLFKKQRKAFEDISDILDRF